MTTVNALNALVEENKHLKNKHQPNLKHNLDTEEPVANTETLKLERYNRQIQVPQIGYDGQEKLANAHVAIIGMGGLGCPVGLYLAGAGVGKLTLIDHDVVSLNNLHRQVLYCEEDVNAFKSETAKKALTDINKEIQVNSHNVKLMPSNIADLLLDVDVLVDATDNFTISYLLSDYAQKNNKPLVSASVMGVVGYVGVYCYGTAANNIRLPSLRAVFPNPPEVGQDCNSIGVIGTASGMMGTLQAQEVMKVILGDSNQLAGRLLSIDLWTYRQSIMDFSNAPEPINKAIIISANQIDESDFIIDVRSHQEVIHQPKILKTKASKAKASKNRQVHHYPMEDNVVNNIMQTVNDLAINRRLVLTCQSGQRALNVADKLIEAGLNHVAVCI